MTSRQVRDKKILRGLVGVNWEEWNYWRIILCSKIYRGKKCEGKKYRGNLVGGEVGEEGVRRLIRHLIC